MTDSHGISRRDFINGIALGVAAGGSLSPLEILAAENGTAYPPALTGMRGSHPGSFEIAHAVAWDGQTFSRPSMQTDDDYDLVVVGGGISGLSAAHFYRQEADPDARILVLDNHDDFGGHAKRNEFTVDGQRLIGYGGSQSIDEPGSYSNEAKKLLADVGIEVQRFYDYFDRDWSSDRGLRGGVYFDRDTYGRDVLAPNILRSYGASGADDITAVVAQYPLPAKARKSLLDLLGNVPDPLPRLDRGQKIDFLLSLSYTRYLTESLGVDDAVATLIRDTTVGLWGVGWDGLSALEAYRSGMPGFNAIGIGELHNGHGERDEPYIFHFPDGNAGVARALVRKLLPNALAGSTMEELVINKVDYNQLDQRNSATRVRLSSTAVDVRHDADRRRVDVTYVQDGKLQRVRGRHVVMACYNQMIPYLCPELPERQRKAIEYAEKVPLVYVSIAVRNWRALSKLGYSSVYIANAKYLNSFGLDFPVSVGDYRFPSSPDQPTVLHGTWVPTAPGQGLTAREQHIAGRRKLYQVAFAQFEDDIRAKLNGSLGPGGFDADRDIAAITVNRWPHGYAYEYNDLSDPAGFTREHGPHVTGRAQIGRISIANSDAAAYAYVNGAIDAAYRAVSEQLRIA